jgi:3-isopropylmalate/(R)-2-methylmalate dehydratase small subunit
MTPFCSHRGTVSVLDRANVDTDQIIPKQFMKSIKRTGFGEHLFHDWRFTPDGKENPDFILNKAAFRNSSILVTRNNFGCGSSREHAVWAIQQYGFKALIAPNKKQKDLVVPAFADIFRNNSTKNGLLTVELSEPEVDEMVNMTERFPGLEATVDLEHQRVTLHLPEELSFHFEIEPSVKEHLIKGLDDIGQTLEQKKEISEFEARHNPQWFIS